MHYLVSPDSCPHGQELIRPSGGGSSWANLWRWRQLEGGSEAAFSLVPKYISRPSLAQDRLAVAKDGCIIYRFRKPWRNGKRAVVMDPMTFLSRLAALIPPPRFHMLSYYGVLAPAASRRDRVLYATRGTATYDGCTDRS